MKKNKVLLVGWDSADWKVIDKLMAEGKMPAIKSLIDQGVRGKIATMDPPLSPMLWTSMATGVRPFKHGVLGFIEPDGNGGVRPVSSHYRKVKAIWNMLTMEGYKSNIVGWWPSNPVETINGCMVSNLFQQEKKGSELLDVNEWPVAEASVYPESLIDQLKDLRVHPLEISLNLISPFVPDVLKLGRQEDNNLMVISKYLAHAVTVHATATELMETQEWDFTAVYHDALDHFSHGYMRFYPPLRDHIDKEDFDLYKNVVEGAYVFHDMMLERLLGMIDENTTVVVVSDHGFHSDHLRPVSIPQVPSGPAVEHAPYGIFVAKGPGIKKGEQIFGASVLDVTPTLLSIMDLPIGKDMDGKPLVDIFEKPKELKYIDSWENSEKFGGELVATSNSETSNNEAALQQLVDLGYIDEVNVEGEGKYDQIKGLVKENNFYLAKSYASAGFNDEALEILLEIEDKSNPDYRILTDIVNCSIRTNRFALADEYIKFIRHSKVFADNYIDVMDAKVQIGLNNPTVGIALLNKAVASSPESFELLLDLGKVYNAIQQKSKAIDCFDKVLKIDPENAYAYYGKGLAFLRAEEYENAVEEFLNAIDRLYHFPVAHLHLGETLALMKEYEAAIGTLELVRTMMPKVPKIYRWLLDLYEVTENDAKMEEYKGIVSKMQIGTKTIISGLPGENLLNALDFLESKGVNIGESKSLFETQQINVMNKDWLVELSGDIIYVPMQYFGGLNALHSYRFIYIQDDVEDASAFLNKKLKIRKNTYNSELLKDFNRMQDSTKTWFSQQPNLDIYYVSDVEKLSDFI
jgi:predicted AlkP superfamily phosphohydrolase/phosphomutase/tetratricopeptide (TPR) repeat protein